MTSRALAAAALLLVPALVAAEEAADLTPAREAVSTYLAAVKAKKWPAAKKQLHPLTVEAIADIKRRTKVENHALAPWARVKESYLTAFEVESARATDGGAVVVSTVEEHFSVEDNGTEEGVRAEYLVLKVGEAWKLVDRRLGEQVFRDGTVQESYKGWFAYEPPAQKPGRRK